MKLIIAGGRDFTDYNLLVKEADSIRGNRDCVIICGDAKGADKQGDRYAKERGLKVEHYPANWERDGLSAGHKRNRVMASVATHLLAFWDGHSKGTKGMIELGKAFKLEMRVVKYEGWKVRELNKERDTFKRGL